jgi:hypothetical protein
MNYEDELIFSGWDHGLAPDEVAEAGRWFRKLRKRIKKVAKKASNVAQKAMKVAAPVLAVASIVYPPLAVAAAAVATASKLLEKAQSGSRAATGAIKAIAHHAKRGNGDAQKMLATLKQVSAFRASKGRYPKPAIRRSGPPNPAAMAQIKALLPQLQKAQLWKLLRATQQGNVSAGQVVDAIGKLADHGDPTAQKLIWEASGGDRVILDRWGAIVAGADPDNFDLEIDGPAAGMVLDVPPLSQFVDVTGYDVTEAGSDEEILAGMDEIIAGGPVWDSLKKQVKPQSYRSEDESWGMRDNYKLGLSAMDKE